MAEPFIKATKSRNDEVRIRAVQALGILGSGSRRAVKHLIETLEIVGGPSPRVNLFSGRQTAFIGGYEAQVARGAVIARPHVGVVTEGTVLDARVVRTRQRTRVFLCAVVQALERSSGERFGEDVRAWYNWYAQGEPGCTAAVTSPSGRQPAAPRDHSAR